MIRRAFGQGGADLLYALAFLGAHLAFMPLFVLLLPRRVEAVAGAQSVQVLSVLLLVGGLSASVAHIAAGAFSDRWFARRGRRRGPIAIGVAAVAATYVGLAYARSPISLGGALIAFQLALNLMFAPLGALLADHIDDARKGRVAAMMNIALPVSGAGTALIAALFPTDGAAGFLTVAALAVAAVIPLLVWWPFQSIAAPAAGAPEQGSGIALKDYGLVWGARLMMQLGASFLLNYFYLFLASQPDLAGTLASRALGALAGLAAVASIIAALAAGLWSDREARRRRPMIAGSLLVALAFGLLAAGGNWPVWMVGYVLFNAGLTAFLSVDSALVAQLVSGHSRRGELLGYMNLTNTIPAVLVPMLTLTALEVRDGFAWPLGFAAAGALALGACALVAQVKAIR